MSEAQAQLDEHRCDGRSVEDVPCGPDPNQVAGCCYEARVIHLACGGRPFVVDGVPRRAAPANRGDWQIASGPLISHLDAEARRALAERWARDGANEHASVASFARFVLELMAVGAPANLVRLAQQAMGDEIRHAELCYGLASAYAGAEMGPAPISMTGALSLQMDLAAIAARAVAEGCVAETVAALLASEAGALATDPGARRALLAIAPDEARHAELAWRFVGWALECGSPSVFEVVAAAFDDAIAALRGRALLTPGHAHTTGIAPATLRHHGQLDERSERAAVLRALDDVVVPCARALLAAR
jgi:hypothetical protein